MIDPTLPPIVGSSLLETGAEDDWHELHRFAELGRLSASLIHEISTPLAAAIIALDQTDFVQFPHLRHMRRNIRLLHRYVEAARQQVHSRSQVHSFSLSPRLNQIRRIVEPVARRERVQLHISNSYPHRLHGDPVKFQQLLTNLILNALQAYDGVSPGFPRRHVYVSLSGTLGWLTITVQDFGRGIPADKLSHIFKPFYTTKTSTGLGIGLVLVDQYVRVDFQGTIKVKSTAGRGTQFKVKLRNTDKNTSSVR